MFSLAPLGDLTRFRRRSFKNEVYLITEDVCIKSNGLLLAARSAKIEEMLEMSENIPAVEFSDDTAGLENCLDLVYGGSIAIGEDNYRTIYKFAMLFQIQEMMEGVLSWIANYVTYDKFWSVYLELKNLHEEINKSGFVVAAKRYLNTDGSNFMESTTKMCRCQDKNTMRAVVELLFRTDDIKVLSVMEDIVDIATENNETLAATTSSTYTSNYLQIIISSTVTYIENFINIKSCDFFNKFIFFQCISKVSTVCTNIKMCKRMIILLTDLNKMGNTVISIKDLKKERVEQLTSPATSCDAIKNFMDHAGKGIHPCVVVEIVLKWWSVRKDREHVDMSFIKPLITTMQNAHSGWYDDVCSDERYAGLMKTLDIYTTTEAAPYTFMFYTSNTNFSYKNNNDCILEDCISNGDGTPTQFDELYYSCNMERHRQSVPAFRYNAAVFPPYGDTEHHWYITTLYGRTYVSLITDSKEEILNYVHSDRFYLNFAPLPGTLQ